MAWGDLPKNLQQEVLKLTQDKEFQDKFSHDPVLDELDDEANGAKQIFPEFLSTINFKLRHNGKEYNNLTPIVWGYLWCIESPIIRDVKKNATQADLDLFFYVLENGIADIPLIEMAAKAANFCKIKNITLQEASEVMHLLASNAFKPLHMFPEIKTSMTKSEPVFDADWLTALVSKVHAVTGYAPDYIMNKLSMTACCFYYVQYARMQGVEHVEKRAPEEISMAKADRVARVVVDRFVETNVIKAEEADEIYKIITSPPAK